MDVAQPHFLQCFQFSQNAWMIFKKWYRFVHRHVQYIGNILSLIPDFQGLPVVPGAMAYFAGYVYIRKKLHFNFNNAIAVAGLAAAAFDVEAESSRFVSPHFGFRSLAEKLPDIIENAGIGGRIRSWRAADGLLVNVDNLIHIFRPFHGIVLSFGIGGMVLDIGQPLIKDFIHQGTLAGARLTGNHSESSQREGNINVLQVML